jgi:hypothetical protein
MILILDIAMTDYKNIKSPEVEPSFFVQVFITAMAMCGFVALLFIVPNLLDWIAK